MDYSLKTERLLLRPLRPEDLDSVWEYAGDRDSIKYMIYFPHDTPEETRQFLESVQREWEKEMPQFYEFAVLLGARIIGEVSLWREEGDWAEIGWILNDRYRGCGYTVEAAKALAKFAADSLGVKRLTALCDTRNAASVRVMEKLGMKLEREQERIYERTGKTAREYLYSWEICKEL